VAVAGFRAEGPGRFRLAPDADAGRTLPAIGSAAGETIKGQGAGTGGWGIVVGHDVPERGHLFGEYVARGLTGLGVRVWLCDAPAAAPMVAFEVLRRRASGGIAIIEGDAPDHGAGVTVLTEAGAHLPPGLTERIGRRTEAILAAGQGGATPADARALAEDSGLLCWIDPRPGYLERLRVLADLPMIARVRLRVVADQPSAAARTALALLLGEAGCEVEVPDDRRAGGPTNDPGTGWPGRIEVLGARVREENAHLGLTTDSEVGRLGVVDAEGAVVDADGLLALLLRHLVRIRGWHGGVARAVGTSHLLDAVARPEGVPVYETDGSLAALADLIAQGTIILADDGEGGLTVRGHLPIADAVLGGLLAAEVLAAGDGLRLGALLDDLQAEVGPVRTRRLHIPVTADALAAVWTTLERAPAALAGRAVIQVTRLGGVKLGLEDGAWVLLRPGRTGVQITVEAARDRDLEVLAAAARQWAAPEGGAVVRTLHAGNEKPDNLQLPG
jgi:phosphomannomutase